MRTEEESWREVTSALRAVYKEFAHYRLKGPVLCEMSGGIVVSDDTPLHDRPSGDFERYQGKALSSLGSEEDYKHFLPRLLELSCLQVRERLHNPGAAMRRGTDAASITIWWVAQKLKYANARTSWRAKELAVLRAFGLASWRWVLFVARSVQVGLGEPMEFLDAVGLEIGSIASAILASSDADDIAVLCREMRHRLDDVLRELSAKGHHQISLEIPFVAWLLGPEVPGLVEEAFFRLGDSPVAGVISELATRLGWLAVAPRNGSE